MLLPLSSRCTAMLIFFARLVRSTVCSCSAAASVSLVTTSTRSASVHRSTVIPPTTSSSTWRTWRSLAFLARCSERSRCCRRRRDDAVRALQIRSGSSREGGHWLLRVAILGYLIRRLRIPASLSYLRALYYTCEIIIAIIDLCASDYRCSRAVPGRSLARERSSSEAAAF